MTIFAPTIRDMAQIKSEAAYRAAMRVGITAKLRRTGAKNLCICSKLYMCFKACNKLAFHFCVLLFLQLYAEIGCLEFAAGLLILPCCIENL